MTTRRAIENLIRRKADEAGVRVHFGYGGKHPHAIFDNGRLSRRMSYSGSPSNGSVARGSLAQAHFDAGKVSGSVTSLFLPF